MEQKVTIKLRVDNMKSLDVKNSINRAINDISDWDYQEDEIGNHFQKDIIITDTIMNNIILNSNELHNINKINHVIDIQAVIEKHGWLYNKRITH